jgi:hypothetical protein
MSHSKKDVHYWEVLREILQTFKIVMNASLNVSNGRFFSGRAKIVHIVIYHIIQFCKHNIYDLMLGLTINNCQGGAGSLAPPLKSTTGH